MVLAIVRRQYVSFSRQSRWTKKRVMLHPNMLQVQRACSFDVSTVCTKCWRVAIPYDHTHTLHIV